jgi:TRAP-type transport system periplasmic protein
MGAMNTLLGLGASAVLVIGAGSLTSSGEAQAPLIIRTATLVPDGSSWHQILKETAARWKVASGGRVTVRLFPGGVAGDDLDVIRKMRLGTLDAAVLTPVGVAEIDRSAWALSTPLLYDSYEEADYVLEKMRPRLEAGLEAKGFVALSWAGSGWVRFFSQEPVVVPDDLRGMKLFSGTGDAPSAEVWRLAGFNPVPLPLADLKAALQAGLVTAFGAPPRLAVITQLFMRAKNMTALRWQLPLGVSLITRATWDKVPAEVRPALLEAARADGKRLQEETRKSEAQDIAEMQKRGLNVVVVDAKARALWQKTAEGFYPRVRGTIVPAEAFDEALRFRDEYRKRPR